MDGFGLSEEARATPCAAQTRPNLDQLIAENAHTKLSASGMDVGLPAGQMGNSEVGHTNIGAAASSSGPAAHHEGDRGRHFL